MFSIQWNSTHGVSGLKEGARAFANSYKDLVVYQKSRVLAKDVFQLTKRFPREEMFLLADQVRRSSRSIGAQIAESWAKRLYEKHFISKLTDPDGEQLETQHWIDVATDAGYFDGGTASELTERLTEIGRMLQSMIDKAGLFCSRGYTMVREIPPEYAAFSPPSNAGGPAPNTEY